jgi:hypothetical protein
MSEHAEHESAGRELAKGAGIFAVHVIAIVVGLVLMFAGIALGVTLVLLPVGIPVGIIGLFVFLWGLFDRARQRSKAGGQG